MDEAFDQGGRGQLYISRCHRSTNLTKSGKWSLREPDLIGHRQADLFVVCSDREKGHLHCFWCERPKEGRWHCLMEIGEH